MTYKNNLLQIVSLITSLSTKKVLKCKINYEAPPIQVILLHIQWHIIINQLINFKQQYVLVFVSRQCRHGELYRSYKMGRQKHLGMILKNVVDISNALKLLIIVTLIHICTSKYTISPTILHCFCC